MTINRHYIRTDESGNILLGYSDAFVQPQEGDICINECGGRHFSLDGEINPNFRDGNGICTFLFGGKVRRKTEEEIAAEKAAVTSPEPTREKRICALEAENASLKEQLAALESAVASAKTELASVNTALAELTKTAVK